MITVKKIILFMQCSVIHYITNYKPLKCNNIKLGNAKQDFNSVYGNIKYI